MSESMVDRVAATLAKLEFPAASYQDWLEMDKAPLREKARAIIEAMREPTMWMILACADLEGSCQEIWKRSIDAALEGRNAFTG